MNKLYFTLKKAQRLVLKNINTLSDEQLQKHIVMLRDFDMYISTPSLYLDKLMDGNYYLDATTQSSMGVVPKDIWLHNNIRYSLDESLKEKQSRMESN